MILDTSEYFTTKELQKYLKENIGKSFNRFYIYKLKALGVLTSKKVGHQNFYPRSTVIDFIRNREAKKAGCNA
jgi:hypothetical protein